MKPGALNAERLLALYERVANAPDAIARLRRFVLDLAVRGKLVEQNLNDEPPTDLLAKARRNLKGKAETARRMRWRQTAAVSPSEIDKDVPSGWSPARVNDTGLYINGLAFKPTDWKQSGLPIIRIQNLTDPSKEFNYAEGEFPDEVMVRNGDLLVSWSATLEAFKWERGGGVLNQHIFRVIPDEHLTSREFLLLLLRNAIREMADSEHAHGLVMTHINRGPFLNHVVLIPPLAEQRRILAKVEELMALLDRLEAARTTAENNRERLTAASLARLTAPDTTPEAFPTHARFALDALPALTTRPDQIKALRQAILNLAVRGELVEQDPNDEPASELLKRMVTARARIVAERRIRGANPPPSPSERAEYHLPPTWELCSLGQITLVTDPNPSHRYPDYSGGVVPILSTREFSGDDGWNPETAKLTTQAFWEFQTEICDFSEGDIVFARKGRLGLPRFLPPMDRFTFSHTLFVIKPMSELAPAYLLWVLRRHEVVDWLTNEMNQNTGVPTLGKAKTERLPVPLPPLAEQHRIVAKVDALMALCDRLEAALTTADTTKQHLLEALLHEALTPAATPRELEAAAV